VLHTLAGARLITTDQEFVEVVHEALIREWPLLRQWLDENRQGLYLQRHLTEAAQSWDKLNRDNGELYRGTRLAGVGLAAILLAIAAGLFGAQSRQSAGQALQAEQTAEARRQEAEAARVEAEAAQRATARAARRAQASQLAMQAQMVLANGEDPSGSLALLLARQAILTTLTEDGYFTPEADAALRQMVDTVPVRRVTFSGHADTVNDAAFSPDGRTIVTASVDKTARLWEVASGAEIRRFEGHTASLREAGFSPDGKTLITASWDKTVRLWDVATGREIRRLAADPLSGYTAGILSAAFSPDGRTIVTTSEFPENSARLWAAKPRGATYRLEGHHSPVLAAAFSPDGRMIITASADQTARLWDVATGQEIGLLDLPGRVNIVAFSPECVSPPVGCGQTLATAGFDRLIRLWDVSTRQEIRRFEGHSDDIGSLAFSPDGHTLVSAGGKPAYLWEVSSGREIQHFEGHTAAINGVAFSPDDQTLVTVGEDRTARLWQVATGQEIRRFEVSTLSSLPFYQQAQIPARDTEFLLFVCGVGQLSAAFSPDGQTVATAGDDRVVHLWDVASGDEIRYFEGHKGAVCSVAFSPDTPEGTGGQTLVTASADDSVLVWDVANGEVIRRLDGHTAQVLSTVFSPDGQTIVTASADKTARLWPSVAALLQESESLIQRDPPEFTPEEWGRFGLEPQ
jgi:WD40 repeat protein